MAVVKSIVELSHDYLAQVLKPGDNVIDATAGNGADTIFWRHWWEKPVWFGPSMSSLAL